MAVSETIFWVLTALAGDRRHGYSVLRETERLSGGAASLRVTTLYATLDRLQRSGLVISAGEEVVGGRARRYFELTESGRVALTEETSRLEARARAARARLTAEGRPSPVIQAGVAG